MDIKSFRVENNELVVIFPVQSAGDALNILHSLRYTQLAGIAPEPKPAGTIVPAAPVDRPAAMQAAALGTKAAAPAAAAPAAAPAAAAAAAPAAAPKRRGRPPKIRPEILAAPVEAVTESTIPESVIAAITAVEAGPGDDEDDGIEGDGLDDDNEIEDEDEPAPAPAAVVPTPVAAAPATVEVVKPLLPTPDTQVLIAKLVEFTKLRDVLYTLKDSGYTTAGQLADVCEELQKDVPVLSRITGLRDRVQRAVQVLGI